MMCPNIDFSCEDCGGRPAGCEYEKPDCDHTEKIYYRPVNGEDLRKNYLCRCQAEAFDREAEEWALRNVDSINLLDQMKCFQAIEGHEQ